MDEEELVSNEELGIPHDDTDFEESDTARLASMHDDEMLDEEPLDDPGYMGDDSEFA